MIQEDLYGQAVNVTVTVDVMGEMPPKDAKDIAVNFVDEAVTRQLVGAASRLGADIQVGAVKAEPRAKRPQSDEPVEPVGDPTHEQTLERDLAKRTQVVSGILVGFLFLLVFLLELSGAW